MKSFDYDAVAYDGAVYCIDHLPDGIDINSDDVQPISADSEWAYPGATCDFCGELHDYMNLHYGWRQGESLAQLTDRE